MEMSSYTRIMNSVARTRAKNKAQNRKILASFFSLFTLFAAYIYFNANGNGIHPIGSNAVYIAGEGCTINFELDRNIQDMEQEFQECVRIHKMYAHK